MELQNYINNNIDDYITKFKNNGLIVKSFSKENLILVKYKFNQNLSEDWMKYCRGCIINKLTNKIIFIPPIKSEEIKYPISDETTIDLFNENVNITTLIDGTMINLFYHNDKWIMSTRSDIGCLNKWNNKVNFKKMFEESIGDQNYLDKLDSNLTYSFVLINKKNRNISNITENCIILIEVYYKDTLNKMALSDINFQFNNQDKIKLINNLNNNFKSIEEINKFFLLLNYNYKGLNININNIRYKIINPKFKYVTELCVNCIDIFTKYIHLKKKDNINLYLNYYPEHKNNFNNYSIKYDIMINELYDNYVKIKITKEISLKEVPFQLKPLIFDIHKIYLNNKKKINKIIINTYILSLDIHKIMFILNYYK